jgi:hypothetical protein
MNEVKVIRLPNGKVCTLPTYTRAWKQLKGCDPNAHIAGFGHFPERAHDVLRALRRGMHDRINRHLPWYGKGRKWDEQWQLDTRRASRDLNHPRLVIHWLPSWLKARFGHRIETH